MNFTKCNDSDCMLCNPESKHIAGVKNHETGELGSEGFVAHVDVTEFGYAVIIFDNDGKEVKTYQAGNNQLDSGPGQTLAVPFETLKRYAEQTASEMLAEHTE